MAMCNEGTHPAWLSQRQRPAVVGLSLFEVELVGMGCQVAEQMQRVGCVTRMGWRISERKTRKPLCVIEPAEKEGGTSQPSIVHAGLVEGTALDAAGEDFLSFLEATQ